LLVYDHLYKKTPQTEANAWNYWYVGTPSSFDEYMRRRTDHAKYPWANFGKEYDDDIVPYLKAIGKYHP
jgi:hypothetical protein